MAQLEKQKRVFPGETKVGHRVGKLESHVFQRNADAGVAEGTPTLKD